METPLTITFRHMEVDPVIENLIHTKFHKLKEVCSYITHGRVVVEEPHRHRQRHKAYGVTLVVTVPPGHELVIKEEPSRMKQPVGLDATVRRAFERMRRKLRSLVKIQDRQIKHHEPAKQEGVVAQVFPLEGYGFVRTVEGEEIYFHRNSVLNGDFEDLEEGLPVRFHRERGFKGPQASSLELVRNGRH